MRKLEEEELQEEFIDLFARIKAMGKIDELIRVGLLTENPRYRDWQKQEKKDVKRLLLANADAAGITL